MGTVRWFHLVAGAVWLGGMITVAVSVPALRRAGVTREQIQVMARRFGDVAWLAMGVLVVTGVLQVWRLRGSLTDPTFFGKLVLKLALVGVAAGFAYWHQTTPGELSARTRGIIQAAILAITLAIFGVAVSL